MKMQHAILPLFFLISALLVGTACQQTTVRGTSGSAMTIRGPHTPVVIQRGHSQALEVGIVREGFTDAVHVELQQLPAGLSAKNASQSVQTDQATFILTADPKADLVTKHQAKVIATRPGGMQATQYVSLTITE